MLFMPWLSEGYKGELTGTEEAVKRYYSRRDISDWLGYIVKGLDLSRPFELKGNSKND